MAVAIRIHIRRIAQHWNERPQPVDENVYARSHLYLKLMNKIQTYTGQKVNITENVPQTFVTKAFVLRKLDELDFVSLTNKA